MDGLSSTSRKKENEIGTQERTDAEPTLKSIFNIISTSKFLSGTTIDSIMNVLSGSRNENKADMRKRTVNPTDMELLAALVLVLLVAGRELGIGKMRSAVMEVQLDWIVSERRVRALKPIYTKLGEEVRGQKEMDSEGKAMLMNALEEYRALKEEREGKGKYEEEKEIEAEEEAEEEKEDERKDKEQAEEHEEGKEELEEEKSQGNKSHGATSLVGQDGTTHDHNCTEGAEHRVPDLLSILEAVLRARLNLGDEATLDIIAAYITQQEKSLIVTEAMVQDVTNSKLYKEMYRKAEESLIGGAFEPGNTEELEGDRVESEERMRLYMLEAEEPGTPESPIRTEEPKALFLLRAFLEAGYKFGYDASVATLTQDILDKHPTWIVGESQVRQLRKDFETKKQQQFNKAWTTNHVAVRQLPDEPLRDLASGKRKTFMERLEEVKEEDEQVDEIIFDNVDMEYEEDEDVEEGMWKVILRLIAALALTFLGALILAMVTGLDGRKTGLYGRLYGNFSNENCLKSLWIPIPKKNFISLRAEFPELGIAVDAVAI